MADKIQTMIPRYGEFNRIYRDYIDNHVFSFDRQKFISDFCQEYNDMKSFEAAILEHGFQRLFRYIFGRLDLVWILFQIDIGLNEQDIINCTFIS